MASIGKVARIWDKVVCVQLGTRLLSPVLCAMNKMDTSVRWNSNRCSLKKINRIFYTLQYPTMIVQPDGSTITIRHEMPRKIIKLPLDPSTLSDEEKIERLKRCRPKEVKRVIEDIEDTFDEDRYSHIWKKNKKKKK